MVGGAAPYHCLGRNARQFNPAIDTFWFNERALLDHDHLMYNLEDFIINGFSTIEHLAFSLDCITFSPPGTTQWSKWHDFLLSRLVFFLALKRVDIVFGETTIGGDDKDAKRPNPITFDDLRKLAELRLEEWTEVSSPETADEVQIILEKVQASMLERFQQCPQEIMEEELELYMYLLPDDPPGWHDGSRITFHAAQVAKDKMIL